MRHPCAIIRRSLVTTSALHQNNNLAPSRPTTRICLSLPYRARDLFSGDAKHAGHDYKRNKEKVQCLLLPLLHNINKSRSIMAFRTVTTALAVLAASSSTFAVDLDVDSTSSVKNAAATIAYGLMSYYTGNQTGASNPGYFDRPTYWWEGGAVWGSLISYYALSNDSSYNPTVTDGLLAQVGQDDNYMPANQTKDLGNDDQSSWALACMDALELGFPNPPSDRPQWLQLAENVWNAQVARWNVQECGGGLKWQLYSFSNGFSYRNSASNGGFFQLSARLARYTGNQTYFDWADKTWDWMSNIGLIGSDSSVYDGTDDTQNCTLLDHVEWSINSGLMLYGSAVLYDYTNGSRTWQSRTELLAEHAYKTFVSSNNSTGM